MGNDLIRHYTDDGEMTACAEHTLDSLPYGETVVKHPDEDITCPTCKAINAAGIKLAVERAPFDDGRFDI